jgi:hypothetical protein
MNAVTTMTVTSKQGTAGAEDFLRFTVAGEGIYLSPNEVLAHDVGKRGTLFWVNVHTDGGRVQATVDVDDTGRFTHDGNYVAYRDEKAQQFASFRDAYLYGSGKQAQGASILATLKRWAGR